MRREVGGREGRHWIRLSSIILVDETETNDRGHWRHWTNKSPGNYYAVSKCVSGSRSQKRITWMSHDFFVFGANRTMK